MNPHVNWENPYIDREGVWLKGNLHTHTSPPSGCAEISMEDCVNRYVELGYDFLSISDHMTYSVSDDKRITFIPGVEWNAEAGDEHTGVCSIDTAPIMAAIKMKDQKELLNDLSEDGVLLILNHPNWQLYPHYRREELEERHGYDGIEIYNGVVNRLDGYAIATDKWDYLLAKGRKVLGFANDDSHLYSDIGLAASYVRARSNATADIMQALKSGNFYSSSGVRIEDIRREGNAIDVETVNGEEIRVIATGGRQIHKVCDKSVSFNVDGLDLSYVRFEIYGKGSEMAWSQPFFIDGKEK